MWTHRPVTWRRWPPLAAVFLLTAFDELLNFDFEAMYARWARRDARVRPAEVIHRLNLAPGASVMDLGAGPGYYTYRLAEAVGPRGTVVAADISPRFLAVNREITASKGFGNVVTRLVAPDDPGLFPGDVDLVFISNTWHLIKDRLRYAEKLRAGLRPSDRLAIVGGRLPPDAEPHRLDRGQIQREIEAAGMRIVEDHSEDFGYSFLIFEPGRPADLKLFPSFTYVQENLAIGEQPQTAAAFRALEQRGFYKVLDTQAVRSRGLDTQAADDQNPPAHPTRLSELAAETWLNYRVFPLLENNDEVAYDLVSELEDPLTGVVYIGGNVDEIAAWLRRVAQSGIWMATMDCLERLDDL